ncbi:hypothetical protein [Williamsia deligens]|uniref:ATP-binding protein n=1 Tax=Williamsia deligens TaxID=321325 RepID=A0ABW3G6X3_9NOCA|nr:hypothetical protein [Williamsia deligens]MCP2193854.1 hypothetical protein [Williamsia deligens]
MSEHGGTAAGGGVDPVLNAVVSLPGGRGLCVETRTADETAIEMLAADGHVVRITVRPGGEIVVTTDGLAGTGQVVIVDAHGTVRPEPAPAV